MLNSRYQKILIGGVIILFGFLLPPLKAKAATLYFSSISEDIFQEDVFIVETRISSPDKLINAAESTILFDKDKLEVKELSSGGSLFSIWLKPPVFSNQDGKITFIGGTPEGFQGEEALVLRIIFLAKNAGETKLDFQDDTALFLHDGAGTRISPWLRSLSLNILKPPPEIAPKDEWQLLIEKDKTPPEPFEIAIGQHPSVFDNQYFISFFTTDRESGIAYYEVKEGDRDFVRAESPYLLKDQSLRSLIKVKAVDKAGNERIAEWIPPKKPFPYWIIILILIGIGLGYWLYRKSKIKYQKSK